MEHPPDRPFLPPGRYQLATRLSKMGLAFVLLTLAVVIIRAFVVEHFYVSGVSMLGTLHEPDRVLVEKVTGRFGEFDRGDVIVFTLDTVDGPRDLVKRVVGLPGDLVEFRDCRVHVDGEILEEPYVSTANLVACGGRPTAPVRLGSKELFVLGDNRAHSTDSRLFGPIGIDRVVGRAVMVFWPPSHWQTL
jgi:signal peptidase I